MTAARSVEVFNRLLAGLDSTERGEILQDCETVHLEFGKVLSEADRAFEYVYFPLTCFISLVTTVGDHQPLEMGMIGSEGLLGATLALGTQVAPSKSIVQGPGSALRIPAARMLEHLRACVNLRNAMNRYLYILMTQLSQSAACLHFHAIGPRLARWLLMTHDRAHANHFHLTHEFLANMLGVRRSGVTIAAGALQSKKIIRYTRGEITILDRDGLEKAACSCYRTMADSYRHLASDNFSTINQNTNAVS